MPQKSKTQKSKKATRKGILQQAYNSGYQKEKVYGGCAQCALAALQDLYGVLDEEVFRAGSALAGGAGLCGDGSCGAYSGSVMFLGQLYGRTRKDFRDTRNTAKKAFDLAKKLHDKFIEEYGSVVCRGIQQKIFGRPFYIRDADEYKKFEKMGAHTVKCTAVVGNAARWVTEILLEEGKWPNK